MIDSGTLKKRLTGAAVPLLFLVISVIGIPLSNYSGTYLATEVVTRMARNSFLVLSLILPVIAGLGINFGMILGAMAGQIGLVFVTSMEVTGVPGILLAALIGTPISILLGVFGGLVLNKATGREMITSMMLGFLTSGIYQFFLLYLCGSVIPINNPTTVLSRGYGIRNALNLSVSGGLDRILILRVAGIPIPLVTFGVITLLCLFTFWIRKTKLGQNMRAVGQDMAVSGSAGINVARTRIHAVVLSTVLACYGQIVYLQNIGTLNTYNGHDQAALFSAAAILVGGATVSKAGISNALLGTGLFHLMFVVMPAAGNTITGNAMLGEYLRMFVSYGVVTIALVMHAWKRHVDRQIDRAQLRDRHNQA